MQRRDFLKLAATPLLAATERRPNMLFVFPDQLRYDWTGLNARLPLRTPHINALAARGMTFTRNVVASPLCAPSRACLASGREYDRCGTPSNQTNFLLHIPTFYALLRAGGYHVLGCGKFDLAKVENDQGIDGRRHLSDWGFSDGINNAGKHDAMRGAVTPRDPYMAYLHQRHLAEVHVKDFQKRKGYDATFPTALPEDAYCDNWLARNGLSLIDSVPAGKPWFLQVNFTGPHPPMDITRHMDEICRHRDFPQPNGCTKFTPPVHVAIRQNYSAMIENIDQWLGAFTDALKRRGELDNTLIVFSSDHGEMLGDHDLWGKTKPHQPSVGVPLIAAGPGVGRGRKSDALVSSIDIGATFLDYAGVEKASGMESRSFRAVLEGRTKSHREHVLSGLGDWRMVSDSRYKYIRGYEDEPMLFDLEDDPLENRNIASKAPAVAARLARLL
jgi:arylsulfatase A-like enzyme